MSLSRQSITLVLTAKNNETQHYIHQKHKRETEKTALANKTNYCNPSLLHLLWPPASKWVSSIFTSPQITWSTLVCDQGSLVGLCMQDLCVQRLRYMPRSLTSRYRQTHRLTWHVISHSGEVISKNCYTRLLTYLLTYREHTHQPTWQAHLAEVKIYKWIYMNYFKPQFEARTQRSNWTQHIISLHHMWQTLVIRQVRGEFCTETYLLLLLLLPMLLLWLLQLLTVKARVGSWSRTSMNGESFWTVSLSGLRCLSKRCREWPGSKDSWPSLAVSVSYNHTVSNPHQRHTNYNRDNKYNNGDNKSFF